MTPVLRTFPCSACGQCCRRVNESSKTAFLDRGDGVCKHFDEQSNLCRIYSERPLVCRVEEYYLANMSELISWDEFVHINVEICQHLQK
ncbi:MULTISPECIES: YkgJ family cysteine cluster protein [Aeromonas]|uniref:YkgJ family cysteine cluster protein n=1 Tax=Aeromonas TaxID=642 RepID=UPI000CDD1B2F|nr:zinc/iron-chelating domain-containing protein [Aeromonas sp. ASNIH4]POU40309.1 zinc/iron-chelating domain-containing protein [Aeromonas hydrophila]POV89752.1 zinc/iron-chelating domain-containing protein [Aeromonas sp. ASNIH6]